MADLVRVFALSLSQLASVPLYIAALYGIMVFSRQSAPKGSSDDSEAARPMHTHANWRALESVGFVAAAYVLPQVFAGVLIGIALAVLGKSPEAVTDLVQTSPGVQFAYFLLVDGVALGMAYLFLSRRRTLPLAIGWVRPRWSNLGYSLAGYGVYIVAYYLLLSVVHSVFPGLNTEQQQDIGFSTAIAGPSLLLVFASLVILPPLVEEVLTRGVLYSGLRRQLPVIWAALITSLLFAAAHLPESKAGDGLFWIGAVDTFTLSLVLVYLREKTGSLWPGIGLHAIKNGIAFLVLFVFHLG